jgi:hypothetical protein
MTTLETEMAVIQDSLDVANASGTSTNTLISDKTAKQAEIDAKQTEINTVNTNITSAQYSLTALNNEVSITNNFTSAQIIERSKFCIETVWSDSNYTNDEDLYNDGKEKLKRVSQPRINYTIDIIDFMSVLECQREWKKLVLGDIVTVRYPNFGIDIEAKMIEIKQSFDNHSITLTIANAKDIICAIIVARAEPLTPSFGKMPIPRIKNGSSIKLSTTAILRYFNGVHESPSPLRIALIRLKPNMKTRPPKAILK